MSALMRRSTPLLNKLFGKNLPCSSQAYSDYIGFKRPDTPAPDPTLRKPSPKAKHPERERFLGENTITRPFGRIYDKKPFKVAVEKGKTYFWCSCGWSHTQPFCDGSHKRLDTTAFDKKYVPKFRPYKVVAEESKDMWFCNCKQSGNRPFCDGTHRREDIKAAIRD